MKCDGFHVGTNNCTATMTTMYELRPIITLVNVRPDVKIYEMRNIHEDKLQHHRHDDAEMPPGTKMPDVTEQSLIPNYDALETRQNAILKRLAELKDQIQVLRKALNISNMELRKKEFQSENKSANNCDLPQKIKGVKASLVLNVNPWRPPYSIYALQKIWTDTDIRVKSYTHSTIIGRVPVHFHSSSHPNSNNIIELTLIYKAVEDLELITHLHKYPIIGEVNFLRYLSRLIDTYNYENATCDKTDRILDLCCRVRHQTSRDKTDELLFALHEELKETKWSGIGKPKIMDIAAWSTIKQFSLRRRVPQFLYEWYESCENAFVDNFSTH